jgi:hypothetical protein
MKVPTEFFIVQVAILLLAVGTFAKPRFVEQTQSSYEMLEIRSNPPGAQVRVEGTSGAFASGQTPARLPVVYSQVIRKVDKSTCTAMERMKHPGWWHSHHHDHGLSLLAGLVDTMSAMSESMNGCEEKDALLRTVPSHIQVKVSHLGYYPATLNLVLPLKSRVVQVDLVPKNNGIQNPSQQAAGTKVKPRLGIVDTQLPRNLWGTDAQEAFANALTGAFETADIEILILQHETLLLPAMPESALNTIPFRDDPALGACRNSSVRYCLISRLVSGGVRCRLQVNLKDTESGRSLWQRSRTISCSPGDARHASEEIAEDFTISQAWKTTK